MPSSHLPIGVFDSGVGGLTVLRALRERLPAESTIYLGDTARVPYGTKSPESVQRYAAQAADHLVGRGIKLLVVACNTASALAIEHLQHRLHPLPVVGVVEPGAEAAVAASPGQRLLVLATESTVRNHAYARAIHRLRPAAKVEELPCSLFVSLAEEGWNEGPIAESVARRYLGPLLSRPEDEQPDTVVLGCTHFPLLDHAIRAVIGPSPILVNSAWTTAESVAALLARDGLQNRGGPTVPGGEGVAAPLRLIATDGAERFAKIGSRFLGERIEPHDIEVVDL